MANTDDAAESSSSGNIQTLTHVPSYSSIICKPIDILSVESATNIEISRLHAKNIKLTEKNDTLRLLDVENDTLRQEVKFLKNKLLCADQVEAALRIELDDAMFKLRAYRILLNLYMLVLN